MDSKRVKSTIQLCKLFYGNYIQNCSQSEFGSKVLLAFCLMPNGTRHIRLSTWLGAEKIWKVFIFKTATCLTTHNKSKHTYLGILHHWQNTLSVPEVVHWFKWAPWRGTLLTSLCSRITGTGMNSLLQADFKWPWYYTGWARRGHILSMTTWRKDYGWKPNKDYESVYHSS